MKKIIVLTSMLFTLTSCFNSLLAQQEVIKYNRGKFVNIGNQKWDEINPDGTHHFKEVDRTNSTISLNKISDPSLTFLFDLPKNSVLLNGSVWSPITSHNISLGNPSNQELVQYEWGKFIHKGGDNWEEVNKDGSHPFREVGRSDGKITLNKVTDKSWTFVLDLNNNSVIANGSVWSKIKNHTIQINNTSPPPSSNPTTSPGSLISFVDELKGHLNGNISGNRVDGKNKVKISTSVSNISFAQMLQELGKTDPTIQSVIDAIPKELKDLTLNEVTGTFTPQDRQADLIMKSSIKNFPVTFQAGIKKINASTKSDVMSFVVGVQPGSFNQVLELIGLNQAELKDFTKLFDLSAGVLFSTMDGKIASKLPIFNNKKVGKGLNMRGTATINFDQMGGSKDQKDLIKKIIGKTELSLTANVPTNPMDTELGAEINTNFNIPFTGDPYVTFNGGKFSALMTPSNPTFSVGSSMTIHINGKSGTKTHLTFGGTGIIEPVNSSFGIGLTFQGEGGINGADGWRNPFGFPGITIFELGGQVNLEAVIPWVKGGLRGKVHLGTNKAKEIKGSMALLVDPNSPQNCLLDLELNKLSIAGFIDAFDIADIGNSELRKGLSSGLENLKVYVSPTTLKLAGKTYKQGIAFNANAKIFGWKSSYGALMDPENLHLKIDGTMDPINIQRGSTQLLSLTGATGGKSRPTLFMEVSKNKFPTADISGKIAVLKTSNRQALLEGSGKFTFDKQKLFMSTSGKLFQGDIQASCTIEATNYSNLSKANYTAVITVKDKGKVKAQLVKEIKKNMKNAYEYVKTLRKLSAPNKPFVSAYKTVFTEYKKVEDDISKSAIYILEKGLNIQEVKLDGTLNSKTTSINVVVKATIGENTINERLSLNVSNLDQAKFIEKIAKELLDNFKDKGVKLFKGLENELKKVNAPVYREVEGFISGTQVANVPKPKSGEGQLTFINEGIYTSVIRMQYYAVGIENILYFEEKLAAGQRKTIEIPKGAKLISYQYEVVVIGSPVLGKETWSFVTSKGGIDHSFKSWGSVGFAQFAEIKNR